MGARGRALLLLADPMLEWHSERPLGDRLRPPPAFADTGLLAHWGLRLDAPDARGPVERTVGGPRVLAASPGRLASRPLPDRSATAWSRVADRQGRATVIADADFLDVAGERALDGPTDGNLDWLVAELATSPSLCRVRGILPQSYPQG